MVTSTSPHLVFSPSVASALQKGQPVVALESAVITHGLPRPENLQLAMALESEVRANMAVPATIGLLGGKIHIGLTGAEVERLSSDISTRKISRRDFGIAIARREDGGTTVAGTLIAARLAGIKVFATGGIGGVHRGMPMDVSADLPELRNSPVVVICAGAKSILDLAATVEYLETMGVPIIGYQTDEFPAFYSRESGLKVNVTVQTPEEIAEIAKAHWSLGLENALLVVNPPPEETALAADQVEVVIQRALNEAEESHIVGSAVTPFLLGRVSELSGGATVRANLDLLKSNAALAARIAVAIAGSRLREV